MVEKELHIHPKVYYQKVKNPSLLNRGQMPEAMIIGAQKAGTTSLAALLKTHPDIFVPPHKELYFFSNSSVYQKGRRYYLKHFKRLYYNVDASANYLESLQAPQRVYETIGPEVKIIVILRNPVERAYSHYSMSKSNGWEPLSFEEALAVEAERVSYGEKLKHNFPFQKLAYREKGIYVKYLRPWIETFGRDNIKILDYQQLAENQNALLSEVLRFLELESVNSGKDQWHKKSKKKPLRNETKLMLEDFYKPHNEALFELIGKRMDW